MFNQLYGMIYDLKRYTDYKGTINATIEHAPYLDCEDGEYKDKFATAIIVQLSQRREFIHINWIVKNRLIKKLNATLTGVITT